MDPGIGLGSAQEQAEHAAVGLAHPLVQGIGGLWGAHATGTRKTETKPWATPKSLHVTAGATHAWIVFAALVCVHVWVAGVVQALRDGLSLRVLQSHTFPHVDRDMPANRRRQAHTHTHTRFRQRQTFAGWLQRSVIHASASAWRHCDSDSHKVKGGWRKMLFVQLIRTHTVYLSLMVCERSFWELTTKTGAKNAGGTKPQQQQQQIVNGIRDHLLKMATKKEEPTPLRTPSRCGTHHREQGLRIAAALGTQQGRETLFAVPAGGRQQRSLALCVVWDDDRAGWEVAEIQCTNRAPLRVSSDQVVWSSGFADNSLWGLGVGKRTKTGLKPSFSWVCFAVTKEKGGRL